MWNGLLASQNEKEVIMSASDNNLDTQKKNHRVPLIGIALSVAFAAALFIAFLLWTSAEGTTPEDSGPQVEVTPGLGATLESD